MEQLSTDQLPQRFLIKHDEKTLQQYTQIVLANESSLSYFDKPESPILTRHAFWR